MNLCGDWGCKNCGHDCCCECGKVNCWYCRKTKKPNVPRYSTCSGPLYDNRCVCLKCRRNSKEYSVRAEINNGWEYLKKTWENGKHMYKCSKCNQSMVIIPHNARIPKRKDDKGWELFEKLITGKDLKNSRKGTLGYIYANHGGIGLSIHDLFGVGKLLWYPKKLYQYQEWVDYMKNTKIKSV